MYEPTWFVMTKRSRAQSPIGDVPLLFRDSHAYQWDPEEAGQGIGHTYICTYLLVYPVKIIITLQNSLYVSLPITSKGQLVSVGRGTSRGTHTEQ